MFQGSHVPKLKDGVRLIIHRRLPKDSRIGNVTFSMDTDDRIFASVEYRYSLIMVLIKHSIQPVGTPGLGLPPSHRATDVAGKREVFRPKPLPLQVGSVMKEQDKNLADLTQFLDTSGIEYEVCSDIRRAMWNKFMINVGINQTCMVYETNYGGATNPDSRAFEDMKKAMHEVIAVAKAEGIDLTEEDFEKDMEILRSLNPEGTPSMRQDALAERPSEVELFAGTMLRIAAQHGIDVPVNRRYYNTIIGMERGIALP